MKVEIAKKQEEKSLSWSDIKAGQVVKSFASEGVDHIYMKLSSGDATRLRDGLLIQDKIMSLDYYRFEVVEAKVVVE